MSITPMLQTVGEELAEDSKVIHVEINQKIDVGGSTNEEITVIVEPTGDAVDRIKADLQDACFNTQLDGTTLDLQRIVGTR